MPRFRSSRQLLLRLLFLCLLPLPCSLRAGNTLAACKKSKKLSDGGN